MAVVTIFGGLSFVSLAGRLYTRMILVRQPGWDDALVVVGMLVAIALDIGAIGCESGS